MRERKLKVDYMDYITMGKRIKDIRKRKGITQEALAEKSGLSSAHISNIETAHTKASLSAVVEIANALDSSVDEILCDSLQNSIYINSVVGRSSDCNVNESRIISDTVDALKKSLIKNRKR